MKWIWVRHGQTAANQAGRYLGHADAALDDTGIIQAKRLSQQLVHEPITHIYASDLQRTMETARMIGAAHRLQPEAVVDLRELHFGEWDGKTYGELMASEPTKVQRWYDDPFALSPPGGETLSQLGERVDRWLKQVLASLEPAGSVVVVTHGGVLRWFQSKWLTGDPGKFWTVETIACGESLAVIWDGHTWRPE